MSDPQRLVDELAGDLTGELLRSVKADAPSGRARARTLVALGVGGSVSGATATAASAAAAAKTGAAVLVVKWAGIGAATAALVIGGAREVPKHFRPSGDAPRAHAEPPELRPSAPAVLRAPEVDQEVPQAPAPVPGPVSANDSPSPSLAAGSRERVTAASDRGGVSKSSGTEADLADEVGALDRVRQALAARDAVKGIALLDSYRKQFPHGVLEPEAVVLRIDALMQVGRAAAARELGEDFLTHHPKSPHAKRIRGLLEGSSNW